MEPQTFSLSSLFTNFFSYFGPGGDTAFTSLERIASHIWLWVIILSYLASFAGLVGIVWMLMRLFDLRRREEVYYTTLLIAPESAQGASPRWERIKELGSGASPSEWREAIIEADIMLDALLSRQGYSGEGVGEKLRQASRETFNTLHDAQEAHGVRNRIAHEGSLFDLSPTLVLRTIARYEAVFREFGVI